MERQRVRDGLVGAAVTVLVLLLAVVAILWSVSDPARDGDGRTTSPGAAATDGGPGESDPPSDLGKDEVWLADVRLEAGSVLTPDARLRDVTAVGRDVRTGPDGLVGGVVQVRATVPFDVVAQRLGDDVTVRAAESGQVTVLRTVELAGRELRVEATGTVGVESGLLVLEPRSIDVGGPAFLAGAIATVVRELVTFEHEIEGLPDGLVLRDVVVRDDGFRASLEGADVRLLP
jgi:hypothetical protein